MFTGIVAAVGTVRAVTPRRQEVEIEVDLAGLPGPVRVGDSISLSGVCCTATAVDAGAARFHLSRETLARTWLGRARVGDAVNLESALRAGDPLGGHLVQGHVDGVGEIVTPIEHLGGDLWVRVPAALLRYCVEKGSLSIDGVSLTIAEKRRDEVRLAIIPHTAQVTTLGKKREADPVHIEVDVIAKYVEQLLAQRDLA